MSESDLPCDACIAAWPGQDGKQLVCTHEKASREAWRVFVAQVFPPYKARLLKHPDKIRCGLERLSIELHDYRSSLVQVVDGQPDVGNLRDTLEFLIQFQDSLKDLVKVAPLTINDKIWNTWVLAWREELYKIGDEVAISLVEHIAISLNWVAWQQGCTCK